jgi:very-short-patch-repair endonuclease
LFESLLKEGLERSIQHLWDKKVIRFWNNDVMNNIDGVILAILHVMEDESVKN